MRANRKGFTLLELLGVIFIISMISYYTVPKSAALMKELDLKSFSVEVQEKTHIAQLRAREKKNLYGVSFSEEGYQIVNQETLAVISVNQYPKNFSFLSSDYTDNTVVYSVDGSPVHSGEILFRYGKDRKLVRITIAPATGRVKASW